MRRPARVGEVERFRDGPGWALPGPESGRSAVERGWEYTCSSPSIKRWYISPITVIDDPHGGAVVSHVNISRRKRSEQELAYLTSAVASIKVWNRFGAAFRWTPPARKTEVGAAAS